MSQMTVYWSEALAEDQAEKQSNEKNDPFGYQIVTEGLFFHGKNREGLHQRAEAAEGGQTDQTQIAERKGEAALGEHPDSVGDFREAAQKAEKKFIFQWKYLEHSSNQGEQQDVAPQLRNSHNTV